MLTMTRLFLPGNGNAFRRLHRSWRLTYGLCFDYVVGIATLRPEGWSQDRRIYLTVTYLFPMSSSPEAHLYLICPGSGDTLCTAKLCPGDPHREGVSPSTITSCFYLGHVYLYLWVSCGCFLSFLYSRLSNTKGAETRVRNLSVLIRQQRCSFVHSLHEVCFLHLPSSYSV